MIAFLKKYKAFGIGLLLIMPIMTFLDYREWLVFPEDSDLELFLITAFWWLLISLCIHKFPYFKKKKKALFKILVLLAFFIIIVTIDGHMAMPDNPITLSFLVVFWFVFFYLLIPEFIKKYWKIISLLYGSVILYFIYVRLFSGGLAPYLEFKKTLALSFFLIPIPLLFGLWTYDQWKWFRNLKSEKAKAELALLKTQINPHFFFNTLNNLYALTVKNSDKAPEVILKLSDMMRYTIYEGKKDIVPLNEVIVYLKNYIDLHKIRYHKSVKIDFTHTIGDGDTIAPLLFIILLENAFKHGVESLTENAFITINLISNVDFIHFNIENNFDSNEISEDKGIGLDNLKRRLELIYPDKHQLSILEKEPIYKVDLIISKQ